MIFVDTSAIYALLDAGDVSHGDARAQWAEINKARQGLATTNYVVLEATSILQSRLGIAAARDLHNILLAPFDVHFVDSALHEAAVHLLLAESRRHLSLVDCTSFLFMRRNSVRKAFTYDRHFKDFGFETV